MSDRDNKPHDDGDKPIDAPADDTAGADNTGVRKPKVEGGQPAVGEASPADVRNTEF